LVPSLKFLAAFGFLQSAVQILNASFYLDGAVAPPDEMPPIRVFAVILLASSAACLLLFGTQVIACLDRRYRWLCPLPYLLFAAWLVSLVVPHVGPVAEAARPTGTLCLQCHPSHSLAYIRASRNWLTGAEIWARYLLCFPGSVLAALALLAERPRFVALGVRSTAGYCVAAAAAFAANAVVTGLVVPPAPYFPASFMNFASFSRFTGISPQIISAGAAVVVAYCVVQILSVFEVERSRQLARADEERFAAQQLALETERRAQAEMVEWNRRLEARVRERTSQLEALHAQLKDMAVLEERDRIARELHDSLAQVLGYLTLRASVLSGLLASDQFDQAAVEATHIQQVADDAYADVREAILGLRTRPSTHDLVPTLEEYLRKYSLQSGIRAALEVAPDAAVRFPPTAEIQLIRIIQEALTNVRKHAGAEHVRVRFLREGDRAVVAVEDDGRGFDAGAVDASSHFGLATMRERTQTVGGNLTVSSAPSQGTRVIVSLPVESAESLAAGETARAAGAKEPTGGVP
jgi:signal transduction histidine kinase